jgi:thiol-disulfide isomerase/thioredoxin
MSTARTSFLMLTLCCAGCGQSAVTTNSQTPGTTPTPKGDAVRLSIVGFDGIMERIAQNRGKVVVMDAWSTSCAPCIQEFHNLVGLHQKYGPEQVACISLSFDYEGLGQPEEQRQRVLAFLRGQRATFDNLLSSLESDELYRKLKLAAVPAVFVYDRAGHLRKRFDNEQAKSKAEAFTYEQVGQLVAELLAEDQGGQLPAANPP